MTKTKKVKDRCISCDTTLVNALKQMDALDCKSLLVFKDDHFFTILSIGDIQRAIIRGIDLDEHVSNVLRTNVRVGYEQDSKEDLKDMMQKFRMELLPILTPNGELKEIIFWNEVYKNEELEVSKLDTPVVIMAGGKGTRLKPVTNIIPKPLIPLGDKPIIELIVESFAKVGVSDFFVSVNYKKEMIKRYFDEMPHRKYCMHYFEEKEPLGTGGSLHLLNGKLNRTFFVTNCDILVNQDYGEILDYHYQNKNELTLVAAIKHYCIPYGTVVAGPGGILKTFREKPEIKYLVNAGMYILEPHLLKEVPENSFYHITELIEKVKNRGGNVGVFPVSEGAWMDIGEWKEYTTTMNKLGLSS